MDAVDNSFNPQRIKALAHPIRLALLEYLSAVDQATATQCATGINESVASCSFHLRTLAKAGFIEQAEAADSKSKPWKLAEDRQTNFAGDTPEELTEVSVLGTAVLEQFNVRMREFWAAAPHLPREAIDNSVFSNMNLWVTKEEHDALVQHVEDFVMTLRERNTHPELRPQGAKHNSYLFAATPDVRSYKNNQQQSQ